MTYRLYDPSRDLDAVRRIWREAGWLEGDQTVPMDHALDGGRGMVAEVNGEAECLVLCTPGTIRHLKEDLPFACVTGVTTSRVVRRQGHGARLTALSVAADVADGAIVSGLGMFEQGFYNRLGFGSGPYEVRSVFDPANLNVEPCRRSPRRLTKDDWALMHASRLARKQSHGACCLTSPMVSRADLEFAKNGFGLGFEGPDGAITHHLWLAVPDDVERGPYSVWWTSYQTHAQLLELLGLLKNLGDQVRAVRMANPPGIQLQDLVDKPFSQWWFTQHTERETRSIACAYWQIRICDLPACLERTHLHAGESRFNLKLHDPIERYLPEDAPWRGVSGEYVVTLGASSGAEAGTDASLPTLEASVNAFSRMWLGVGRATGLSATTDLKGPRELLEELDQVVCLPKPHTDWDF